jgi:hypothetical protein
MAIWDAVASAEPSRQSAPLIVSAIIAAVGEEIKLQYGRCCRREHLARQLPTNILAMRRLQPADDDFDAWKAVGLCQVLGAGGPGGGHLVVLLSASWPVPAPV